MTKIATPNFSDSPFHSIGRVTAIVSVGLFVIVAMRSVDEGVRIRAELQAQKGMVAESDQKHLELIECREQAASVEAGLQNIHAVSVTDEELNAVQDRLMALARQTKCTLKKAAPRSTIQFGFEDVVGQQSERDSSIQAESVPFHVGEVGLAVAVEGDLASTLAFLKSVQGEAWMFVTNQLDLRRNATGQFSLELEIGFQSLQRKAADEMNVGGVPPRA